MRDAAALRRRKRERSLSGQSGGRGRSGGSGESESGDCGLCPDGRRGGGVCEGTLGRGAGRDEAGAGRREEGALFRAAGGGVCARGDKTSLTFLVVCFIMYD